MVAHDPAIQPKLPRVAAVDPRDGSLALQEAHHRIANHFALLDSYVNIRAAKMTLQEVEPDRASMLLLLEGIRTQIQTVARVHRLLATVGNGAMIDVGSHLHEILAPFASRIFGEIKLNENLELGCLVRSEQMLPISQIVAEVVTIAIKHGKKEKLTVSVSCHQTASDRLLIEILDDGPGFPAGIAPSTRGGTGMRMLKALALQVQASVDFGSTPQGLRFHLSLPV